MSAEVAPIDWDTYEPTKAVRKAAMVLFEADAVEAVCFGWVPQAHAALAAALDVEGIAEAMARRATPQYWSDEHRDMLLTLNPDETRVDEILDEMRLGQVARFRIQAANFRAEILGADS